MKQAVFVRRPNRFIAEVEIEGKKEVIHVKNTGRCRELLTEGAEVYVREFCGENRGNRKTAFDLISVKKGDRLVNMDSQAPNKAVFEWLERGGLFKAEVIKPEFKYGDSRIDFYAEGEGRRALIEVKGVTLENDGVVSFPDAPTERGRKHLAELERAVGEGHEAYVFFVIQMKGVKYFTPNAENDPKFAEELKRAADKGVKILAYDCDITVYEMNIRDKVDVVLV